MAEIGHTRLDTRDAYLPMYAAIPVRPEIAFQGSAVAKQHEDALYEVQLRNGAELAESLRRELGDQALFDISV